MDQAEKKRKLLIGGALIATVIAVVLVEEEEAVVDTSQTVQSAPSSSARQTRSGQARVDIKSNEYLAVDQLGQRKFSAKAGELFNSTSWTPERPSGAAQQANNPFAQAKAQAERAAPPPAPKPPPLPFKYIGKIIEGNALRVFLADADDFHIVRPGGRIDDKYRVDTVNDETITLTYLPLNARQVLTINDKKPGNNR